MKANLTEVTVCVEKAQVGECFVTLPTGRGDSEFYKELPQRQLHGDIIIYLHTVEHVRL